MGTGSVIKYFDGDVMANSVAKILKLNRETIGVTMSFRELEILVVYCA